MAEKKLEGKPRTVGAAKKAGSKFFYDKNGTKKLAVTAEELKKSGKTLTQWANDWKKPGSSTAVSKSLRPKKRPPSGGSVSAVTAKETAEVKAANLKIKADRAAKAKRLMEELKAKLKMQAANKEAADSKKKITGDSSSKSSAARKASFKKKPAKTGPTYDEWKASGNKGNITKYRTEMEKLGLPPKFR
tara:strand:+ start:182 stop:748 length:567 start_codon:yes stop_codon:yes gene_type:complete